MVVAPWLWIEWCLSTVSPWRRRHRIFYFHTKVRRTFFLGLWFAAFQCLGVHDALLAKTLIDRIEDAIDALLFSTVCLVAFIVTALRCVFQT